MPCKTYEKKKVWKHLPALLLSHILILPAVWRVYYDSLCWESGNQHSYSLKMSWLNGEKQCDF